MASNKSKGRKHLRHEILLPVFVTLLMAAACIAAVKFVLIPAIGSPDNTVTASVPSSSLSALSSPVSASSSLSQASSAASKIGSYNDFTSAVFIGDSITSGISEYSITQTAGVYATNALSTSSVLTQKITVSGQKMLITDAMKQAKPSKVYILLGANDITWMSQSTFITNYGKLIDALKADTPDAAYYVQSIFPVSAAYETKTHITNDKINTFNSALSAMCTDKSVKYVDAGQVLKGSDGKLLTDAATDGYNIKNAYYKKWLDYLIAHE